MANRLDRKNRGMPGGRVRKPKKGPLRLSVILDREQARKALRRRVKQQKAAARIEAEKMHRREKHLRRLARIENAKRYA